MKINLLHFKFSILHVTLKQKNGLNAQDKQLTELLERWQSGDFTSADEQALRRLLAERDDFRQEATEGLLAFPDDDHATRMARLRQRLHPEQRRPGTVIPLRTWLTLAASVTALVVAAWWLIPGSRQESAIARDQSTTVPAPGTELPPPPTSTAPQGNAAAKPTTPRTAADKVQPPPTVVTSDNGQPSATSPAAGAAPEMEALKADDAVAYKQKEEPAPIVSQPAVVSAAPPGRVAESKDEVVAAASKKAKASRALPAPQRNADLGNDANNNNVSQSPPGTAIARPTQGWTAFNTYLRNNARLTPEAKAAGVKSGKVVLNVVLGADGSVQQVGVVERLGYGCDELAERLLRSSTWTLPAGALPYFNVEVPFER